MLARWSTRTVPAHHHGDASPTSPSSTASKKRVSRSLFEIESWAQHPPELSHWPNAQLSRVWQSAVPLPPSPPSPSPHGISTTTLATGHWSRWVFIVFHHDKSTFSMFRHPFWSVPLCGTPRAELHPWLPYPSSSGVDQGPQSAAAVRESGSIYGGVCPFYDFRGCVLNPLGMK